MVRRALPEAVPRGRASWWTLHSCRLPRAQIGGSVPSFLHVFTAKVYPFPLPNGLAGIFLWTRAAALRLGAVARFSCLDLSPSLFYHRSPTRICLYSSGVRIQAHPNSDELFRFYVCEVAWFLALSPCQYRPLDRDRLTREGALFLRSPETPGRELSLAFLSRLLFPYIVNVFF